MAQPVRSPTADVWEALRLTNDYRAKTGALPVCINPELTVAATRHATDMANKRFLSHVGSDNSTMIVRVSATGYAWRAAAENVLFHSGELDAPKAINMWIGSAGHAANMRNADYKHVGMARVQGLCPGKNASGLKCWYWAQVLGRSFKGQLCWTLVRRPAPTTTPPATVRPRQTPARIWSNLGLFEQPSTEIPYNPPAAAAEALLGATAAPALGQSTLDPSSAVPENPTSNSIPAGAMTLVGGILIAGTVIAVGAMFMVIRESLRMQLPENEESSIREQQAGLIADEEELAS